MYYKRSGLVRIDSPLIPARYLLHVFQREEMIGNTQISDNY